MSPKRGTDFRKDHARAKCYAGSLVRPPAGLAPLFASAKVATNAIGAGVDAFRWVDGDARASARCRSGAGAGVAWDHADGRAARRKIKSSCYAKARGQADRASRSTKNRRADDRCTKNRRI